MKQNIDEMTKFRELRKKIDDKNWIKNRIEIFYNKYPIFKDKRDCKLDFVEDISPANIVGEERDINRILATFEYNIDEDKKDISDEVIHVYLENIMFELQVDSHWENYEDIIKIIRMTILHEYRHCIQIRKLKELNMLDLSDEDWVEHLLEEDAENYAKVWLDEKKELDLSSIITKIVVEDKIKETISVL